MGITKSFKCTRVQYRCKIASEKPRERTREEAAIALKEGERESGGMNRTGRHNRRHGQSLQRN